jgi:hypothetical protein
MPSHVTTRMSLLKAFISRIDIHLSYANAHTITILTNKTHVNVDVWSGMILKSTNSGQRLQIVLLPIVVLMICSLSFIPSLQTTSVLPSTFKNGPYLDNFVYKISESETEDMQALQEGEVDIIGYTIDPSLVPMLSESQNIEVATTLRNGYGFLIINCQKYPYNLTAFRRALAFAMDKNSICDDIWDGFAEPLDSLVPKINPFSIEGQLPYCASWKQSS